MLLLLATGWTVVYANRTVIFPLLSIIAAQFSLSSADAGLLTGVYFFAYLILQIPAGMLGDRFGMKRVLLWTFALTCVGTIGMGLHGLGAGGFYPCSFGMLMQKIKPERRALSSAVLGIGMAAGLVVGMTSGGALYEVFQDIRVPILAMAIPTIAMWFLFYRYLPDTKGAPAPAWSQYRAILLDWDLWRINISTFTALYGFWVAITWGPTFLKAERGFSLGAAGFYTGLIAVSAIPAAIFWGRMADRMGRKKVAAFVLPASAVALYLLSVIEDHNGLIGALILFGMLSNTAFVPSMLAWSADIVEKRHPGLTGASVGIFNCSIMSSAVVAPIVSGFLRDQTHSLGPAIIAAAALMLAGALLLLTIPSMRRKED
jgi:predicted MFS family arabinose efflux permease